MLEGTYFPRVQLVTAIPRLWIQIRLIQINLLSHNHRIIRGSRILADDELISNKLYSYLNSTMKAQPSPKRYFENSFKDNDMTGKSSTGYLEKLHVPLLYGHFSIKNLNIVF